MRSSDVHKLSVGRRWRRIRVNDLQLNQQQLAERLGCTRQLLSMIERGERLPGERLAKELSKLYPKRTPAQLRGLEDFETIQKTARSLITDEVLDALEGELDTLKIAQTFNDGDAQTALAYRRHALAIFKEIFLPLIQPAAPAEDALTEDDEDDIKQFADFMNQPPEDDD